MPLLRAGAAPQPQQWNGNPTIRPVTMMAPPGQPGQPGTPPMPQAPGPVNPSTPPAPPAPTSPGTSAPSGPGLMGTSTSHQVSVTPPPSFNHPMANYIPDYNPQHPLSGYVVPELGPGMQTSTTQANPRAPTVTTNTFTGGSFPGMTGGSAGVQGQGLSMQGPTLPLQWGSGGPRFGGGDTIGPGWTPGGYGAPQPPTTPFQSPPWQNRIPQPFDNGGMPTNNAPRSAIDALMDPTPYNNAINRGGSMIGSIPNSAAGLRASSPAFGNLSSGMQSALDNQWNARGNDLQNQAGLEFSRMAGTRVPQQQLQTLLGLRGLENDWLDLGNDFYSNDVARRTGSMNTIMDLLGALGAFF